MRHCWWCAGAGEHSVTCLDGVLVLGGQLTCLRSKWEPLRGQYPRSQSPPAAHAHLLAVVSPQHPPGRLGTRHTRHQLGAGSSTAAATPQCHLVDAQMKCWKQGVSLQQLVCCALLVCCACVSPLDAIQTTNRRGTFYNFPRVLLTASWVADCCFKGDTGKPEPLGVGLAKEDLV